MVTQQQSDWLAANPSPTLHDVDNTESGGGGGDDVWKPKETATVRLSRVLRKIQFLQMKLQSKYVSYDHGEQNDGF